MQLSELKDLAQQVAERTNIPQALWLAAVRSAISAGGRFDERLEILAEETVTLVAGNGEVALPTGYEIGHILGVFTESANGERVKLLRWRETDDRLPAPLCGAQKMTWDTPRQGFLSFFPVQEEDTTVVLKLRFVPSLDTDEVPEWVLYGALKWLGANLLQDMRTQQWAAQFSEDMESAIAQAITATSLPIRLGG